MTQMATVEVKYVNPPKEGKQYGSIKGVNNDSWPVKRDRIREFEPNNTYQIAYTESDNGFKNIIGVKQIASEPQLPPGEFTKVPEKPRGNGSPLTAPKPQAPKAQAKDYYRPTSPRDSERMFTCAIAGHWIDTGRVEMTEEGMISLVQSLRKVYAATFGADDQG